MSLSALEETVTEDDELGTDPEPDTETDGDDETVEKYFANAEEWVNEWMIPHFRRDVRSRKWAPHWFRYPEAVTVFEGLWDLWESARAESPGAVAEYMRVQFYPLMDIITGPDGPFWAYDEALNKRQPPENWKTEKAPEGMFRDRDHPDEQA